MKQLLFFINFFTECLRYINYSIFQLISIIFVKNQSQGEQGSDQSRNNHLKFRSLSLLETGLR